MADTADQVLKGERYADASHFASEPAFEVQRTNHFEVVIDLGRLNLTEQGADSISDHIRMSTKSVSAPKVTAEQITLKHGNDSVKVAAAPSVEDLQLTLYDTLGIDQISLLQKWFDKVFNHRSRLMGMATSYKTDGTLYMYSPDCSVIRKWKLKGIWPKDYGVSNEFSFDSADAQNVTVTLSVDRYWETTNGADDDD